MITPGVTALVPMKAHSERVPSKNVRPFVGRPLFHWIMETLRSSSYVGDIVVNTDCETIARQAEELFGAVVLWRPEHLLGDMVGIQPLIEWDLQHTDGDLYLQTHSTNPLLTADTIDRAVETFCGQDEHDSLFTVTELYTRLFWSDGRPLNHDPDHMLRTQDLDPVLEENSCIYIFPRETFERRGHRLGAHPLLMPMDPLEAVDIDDEHDFVIAEAIMIRRTDESGN
ncbi:MAG: acylneuraminate cytidylyltransferase family protein [Dehalococcoidia bacterium]